MPFLFSSTMVKGSNIEWNDATVMYPDGNTTDGISLCKTTNNGETTNSPEDAITFVATPVQGVVFNPKKVSVSVAFNATSTNFSYDILLEQGDKSVLLGNIPGTGPKQKRIDMTYDITDAMGFSQSDEVLKVLVRLSYPWGNLKTFLGNVTIEGDAVLPAMDMYTITTGVAPENSGSVNPATVYTINGWETKFTAEPAEKHFFKHWESNGVVISTENPLFKDDFSSDMQLTAVFDRLAEYTLNWNIEGDASNKVTVTTDKELSGNSAVLDNNTSVRFTAIAADGYEFRGWMDASREIISYNNPYTFAIGENTSVTALFAKLGADQAPAFPTAEGFGKWATGGRGGKVVTVTNLEDDAAGSIEGSFRWALKQYPGEPLTVVFNVSGIIDFKGHDLRSNRSNVTIAGQTAPGDGICFKGGCLNFGGSRNLIIRHIRSRLGLLNETDFIEGASINIENGGNFIIDHCSFSWSAEEVVNVYDNDNTTIQWCVISEGLYSAGHGKGDRAYAAVLGGRSASYHHNLLAHNNNRTPRFGCTTPNDMIVLIDYVNNVNYNWGKSTSCYGGDNRHGDESLFQLNMINNYYKPFPASPGTSRTWFLRPSYHANTGTIYCKLHLNGNFI